MNSIYFFKLKTVSKNQHEQSILERSSTNHGRSTATEFLNSLRQIVCHKIDITINPSHHTMRVITQGRFETQSTNEFAWKMVDSSLSRNLTCFQHSSPAKQ